MIEIKFTGMCEGCKHADIDLQRIDIECLDKSKKETQWAAFCTHREACEEMQKRIIKKNRDTEAIFAELDKQDAEQFNLGCRIKQRLDELGMSQRELAQAVKITEVSMSRYINNDRTPKGPLISQIAKALDVSCDWLLGGNAE